MSDLKYVDPKWNESYAAGTTPWNIEIPSRELTRVLDAGLVSPGTALELGCGTGTNAVFLAERGFQVTAVDGASLAIDSAKSRGARLEQRIRFLLADVCALPDLNQTFDFVFDRGCFHCVRKLNLAGYLEGLERYTHAGSRMLLLTGNVNETSEGGPPRLSETDIWGDLGGLFEVLEIREFRFDNPEGPTGPLGWSTLLRRKAA